MVRSPCGNEEVALYDMKNLDRLAGLEKNAADGMQAFWAFDGAAFRAGSLSALDKQFIAVGVALATQCPYCIELHASAARRAGATDQQLAETALVAAAIRAGGAITHATHIFEN